MKSLLVLILVALLLGACAPAGTATPAPALNTPSPTAQPPSPPTATPVPASSPAPVSTAEPVRTLYPAPTNLIPATLVATEVSPLGFVHEYSVDAWFDNPDPPLGSNVILSMSLLHNGIWAGGGTVTAQWVQDGELRTCSSLVIYQRGICTIPVTGFEPGVYVPITYTFNHDGKFYTGYTGFTPRLPPGTPTPAAKSDIESSPVYTETAVLGLVDTYFVEPGLDDATPPLGGRVMVRARLMKNGVRLGGIPARVTWVQGGEARQCDFLPLYQNGCAIDVRGFPPGVYVPVTVTMRYHDMLLTAYAGFTPR